MHLEEDTPKQRNVRYGNVGKIPGITTNFVRKKIRRLREMKIFKINLALLLVGIIAAATGCGTNKENTATTMPVSVTNLTIQDSFGADINNHGNDLVVGDSFSVGWEVNTSGSANDQYSFSFYINTLPLSIAKKPLFTANCSSSGSSLYKCGTTGKASCEIQQSPSSYDLVIYSCKLSVTDIPQTLTTEFFRAPDLAGIGQACIYDNSMNQVCDEMAIPLTLSK